MYLKLLQNINSQILKNPLVFKNQMNDIMDAVGSNIESVYKYETPVQSKNLRDSVVVESEGFQRTIGAKATYALYVHGGQGKYKGGADGGRSQGKVKAYSMEEIRGFKAMRSRGVVFNIKPNKFADRTHEKTKEKAIELFKDRLGKML